MHPPHHRSPHHQPPRLAAASLPTRLWARMVCERGQATAEYALVLLGVAAIAMMLLAWAGQTDAITGLFDAVIDSIVGLVP